MKNHPRGLPVLFFTEMWERFGYYLMIGIFFLYMTDSKTGGLAMDRKVAADIFGTFIACVYVTPFIGGLLADRLLGFRRSIIIGGLLMGCGYLLLAVPGMPAFYSAMALIVLGNGFFKPNISTLLGNLYNEPRYLHLKDSGFNWFYFGINLGAFVCNFFAAWLRNSFSWGHAFAAAGVGMFIGVAVFILGNKHVEHADVRPEKTPESTGAIAQLLTMVLLPAIVTGALGWLIPGNIFGSDSTDAFLLGTLPIIFFFLNLWRKAATIDRRPIAALLAIYAVVVAFWAVFKQNGTALTTWAEFYTDRGVPAAVQTPLDSLKLLQTVKMVEAPFPRYDSQFRTSRDSAKNIIKISQIDPYFLNENPELRPPVGGEKKVISTEIFQSVNPLWVMILTPAVIWFFGWLRKRKREPTTPSKIGWGLVISSLSSVVMVFAVWACHNGGDKASAWWLIGTYGVITVGELCLSPMGLSLVSKMAPRHLAGVMMGGWQLATAIGNKLSGVLGGLWDNFEDKSHFFWLNTGLLAVASVVMFFLLGWLNRVFREKGLS